MPTPIVECIPNFSEARRPEVVDAIVQSIETIPGVHILDKHSDLDHNRTVITFVGPPSAVEEAAFQAIAKAANLIDLDRHSGEHPRIGATDVVPFVPISGVTMMECIEIARHLGRRVANELKIPVYLYEEAATRVERRNLEDIRRGQYEALKEEIQSDPDRKPDFGPCQLGNAGATVIGARQPLIAYNIYLSTDDVSIAQKIAKAVRQSSGGFRFVKALGLLVDGRAQVSMNLTDFHHTPMARVVEFVRREAARYGVNLHHSELVGLVPQEALIDAAQWYMQMDEFLPEQILEQTLFHAMTDGMASESLDTTPSFLDELAAATPTPGGGSAAAYAAATGAALITMVARLTVGKKKYADVEGRMWEIIDQSETLRIELMDAVERDSQGFKDVMTALRLSKDTPEAQEIRQKAIDQAYVGAAQVPIEVARKAVDVLALAEELAYSANLNAISDAASGAALARAALTSAGLNVRINTQSLQDQKPVQPLMIELKALESKANSLEEKLHRTLIERGGMSFN